MAALHRSLLVLEALESTSPYVVATDNGRRLPLAYHLLDRDDEALALLPALRNEVGVTEGPWADAMKVFIERLGNALRASNSREVDTTASASTSSAARIFRSSLLPMSTRSSSRVDPDAIEGEGPVPAGQDPQVGR